MNRYNSTITIKPCKCGCGKPKKLGLEGYATLNCMPEELRAKSKYNTKNTLARANKAKLNQISRQLHKDKENKESGNHKAVLHPQSKQWEWFAERRKEMANCCTECGRCTQKANDKFFHWQICHIVPKSLVPSVATNEYNWVELCWLHHQEFDSTFEKASKMMCFGEVKQKFQLFKHLIPPEELRKVNPNLLNDYD